MVVFGEGGSVKTREVGEGFGEKGAGGRAFESVVKE